MKAQVLHHAISGSELPEQAQRLFAEGFRLALVAAHDDDHQFRVVYLFLAGQPDRRVELECVLDHQKPEIQSLARLSFPAGRFEREMSDLFGIWPLGHPKPERLVRHAHWPEGWYPMRADADVQPDFAPNTIYPFVPVEGPGVYEIPVGPIHAGMIEPGHFRFSVVGETVLRLKARLWFTHRGIEKLFQGQSAVEGIQLAENISGDTSVGHGLAYVLAVEDALGLMVDESVHRLRFLLVELERLYNHATDLGALANDAGFSIAHNHAQRVREQLLRFNEAITGNRLLRGAIYPGGVALKALPDLAQLQEYAADLEEIAALTLANGIVYDRFAGTAVLSTDDARELGCLGYVARASGLACDARVDHPMITLPVTEVSATGGDVLARYMVRREEISASVNLIQYLVKSHRGNLVYRESVHGSSGGSGVGIVEGWRGTIVHRVELDAQAKLTRVKVVDPSWFNWPAVPVAMTDTIVPDFPLTNKSFNLSYSGNDL